MCCIAVEGGGLLCLLQLAVQRPASNWSNWLAVFEEGINKHARTHSRQWGANEEVDQPCAQPACPAAHAQKPHPGGEDRQRRCAAHSQPPPQPLLVKLQLAVQNRQCVLPWRHVTPGRAHPHSPGGPFTAITVAAAGPSVGLCAAVPAWQGKEVLPKWQLHMPVKAFDVKAHAMKQCRILQLTTLMTQLHRTKHPSAYDMANLACKL